MYEQRYLKQLRHTHVYENILVADNYSITQLTVTETQYIAVPDVFKVSNLSVTATPTRAHQMEPRPTLPPL